MQRLDHIKTKNIDADDDGGSGGGEDDGYDGESDGDIDVEVDDEGNDDNDESEGRQKEDIEVDMEEDEVKVRWEHEEEEGEGTVQKELPKIKQTRRRRNIIVGWLYSKIVKGSVQKKVLLKRGRNSTFKPNPVDLLRYTLL